MSEPAISGESYGGWLRLACGIGFAFVLPIRLLLAAGFLKPNPLRPFSGGPEWDHCYGADAAYRAPAQAIFESGLWVALLLGIVAMMAMLWALLDRRQRGQSIQLRRLRRPVSCYVSTRRDRPVLRLWIAGLKMDTMATQMGSQRGLDTTGAGSVNSLECGQLSGRMCFEESDCKSGRVARRILRPKRLGVEVVVVTFS